jgi:hypothetical protein
VCVKESEVILILDSTVVPLTESTDAARLILDCLLVVSVRLSLQRQASSMPDNTQSEQVWKAFPLGIY